MPLLWDSTYSEFIFVTRTYQILFHCVHPFSLADYEFSEGMISALFISLFPAPNFIESIHEVLTDGKPNELIVEIFSFE